MLASGGPCAGCPSSHASTILRETSLDLPRPSAKQLRGSDIGVAVLVFYRRCHEPPKLEGAGPVKVNRKSATSMSPIAKLIAEHHLAQLSHISRRYSHHS